MTKLFDGYGGYQNAKKWEAKVEKAKVKEAMSRKKTKKKEKKALPTYLAISTYDTELDDDPECQTEFYPTVLEAKTLEKALAEAKLKLKGDPDCAEFGECGDACWDNTPVFDGEGDGMAFLVRIEAELPIADWYEEIQKHLSMMEDMPEDERKEVMRKAKFKSAKATYLRLREEFEGDASISKKRRKKAA